MGSLSTTVGGSITDVVISPPKTVLSFPLRAYLPWHPLLYPHVYATQLDSRSSLRLFPSRIRPSGMIRFLLYVYMVTRYSADAPLSRCPYRIGETAGYSDRGTGTFLALGARSSSKAHLVSFDNIIPCVSDQPLGERVRRRKPMPTYNGARRG